MLLLFDLHCAFNDYASTKIGCIALCALTTKLNAAANGFAQTRICSELWTISVHLVLQSHMSSMTGGMSEASIWHCACDQVHKHAAVHKHVDHDMMQVGTSMQSYTSMRTMTLCK